jgi:hypothetical protein
VIRLLIALGLALTGCTRSDAQAPINEQWRAIELTATPVALGAERVGALRFRGGLALVSSSEGFGGLSGAEMLDAERLLAVTDTGEWFSARLVLDDSGALIGVAEPRLALMRDEAGEPFETKDAGDSEDLAQLADGRFAVSFEQTQSIRLYDLNRDGPFGAAAAGPRLDDVARLAPNEGLEAIVADADGNLVVGAETGVLWRAPLDAQGAVPPIAQYRLGLGFGLTSLDRLPDGDFVALERFYAPVIGARMRITRVSAESLSSRNALARTTVLASFGPPLNLDNFEAIAVARAPDGGVRLYVVSDDNFSDRFRTLIYAFDIVEN